jgi:glycosyl hydrolase family 39 (putative alpha-L-iduronidase)
MHRLPAIILLILILSACTPSAPTLAPVAPTATAEPAPTPLPTPTVIRTPMPDTLFVDPSVSLGPISPLVYGSNYGPWLSVSFPMLQAAYDSGVTLLRFPAGSWGDHNDVKTYQIDQFMDFANKVGAAALFSVRLLDGTPEQAAEMVRYTNIEKKYNVQYWNIGNEPTLYNGEMKNRGETYDVNRFNQEWRAFADAMKNVDPTIKLVGPEINQFSYDTAPGTTTNFGEWDETWMIEFLKANGDIVDVVSFHRYPFPATRISGAPSMDELRLNAQEWDKIILRARELIHEHTGRDLPIAVTEFNSAYDKSYGGETTPDSHFNAIWMADVLGRMIKNGVFMANQWALTAKAGYGGLGLIAQDDVFPSYYTYQLYKKFGNELVYSSSDDLDLSIYAARRADGALTVMVINLSQENKSKTLQIREQAQLKAETWLFDAIHKAENTGSFNLSSPITFPPHSITLYILPK